MARVVIVALSACGWVIEKNQNILSHICPVQRVTGDKVYL